MENAGQAEDSNGCQPKQGEAIESSITLSSIQDSINLLITKVDNIGHKQELLDQDISGTNGLKHELHSVAVDTGENSSSLAIQSNQFSDLKSEVDLLKSLVIKQSQQIAHLHAENDDLRNRSMRNNVLFHNLYELNGSNGPENAEQTVIRFLQNTKMPNVKDLVFERVHRLGQYKAGAKAPRLIVARFLSSKDTEQVLFHAKSLPRGEDDKLCPRITPQYSTQLREKRRTLAEVATEVKNKTTEKVTTKINKDRLYINNNLHHEPVVTPTPAEILTTTAEEKRAIQNGPTLIHGDTYTLGGHTFTATVAEVTTIQDIRAAYKKLLLIPSLLGAAHNICAYSLFNHETTNSLTGYQDDGEHGAGRFIGTLLKRHNAKNIVMFVTRRYLTSAHLGAERFNTMEDAVNYALSKLE
jgi:uncharacterized protein YgiM (DUF1202 family)